MRKPRKDSKINIAAQEMMDVLRETYNLECDFEWSIRANHSYATYGRVRLVPIVYASVQSIRWESKLGVIEYARIAKRLNKKYGVKVARVSSGGYRLYEHTGKVNAVKWTIAHEVSHVLTWMWQREFCADATRWGNIPGSVHNDTFMRHYYEIVDMFELVRVDERKRTALEHSAFGYTIYANKETGKE